MNVPRFVFGFIKCRYHRYFTDQKKFYNSCAENILVIIRLTNRVFIFYKNVIKNYIHPIKKRIIKITMLHWMAFHGAAVTAMKLGLWRYYIKPKIKSAQCYLICWSETPSCEVQTFHGFCWFNNNFNSYNIRSGLYAGQNWQVC